MAKRKKGKPRGKPAKPGEKIGGKLSLGGKRAADMRKRLFAFEYLRNGANVVEASEMVHISSQAGGTYLKCPLVKAIISEEMSKRSGAAKLSVESVLREIAAMAFTVIQDFASWTTNHVALVPSAQLTRDQGRCIQSVEETKDGRVKIKLYDKTKVIALAAQVLKMIGVESQSGQQSASESAALIRKMFASPLAAPEPRPAPTREEDQANLQPHTGKGGKA